jgi:dolichol-phosphate mannosyltransferase
MALVSVVFSFRNERECLPHLFERLTAVAASEPEEFEFVFVDDRSSDDSADIIRAHANPGYTVKLVQMSRRWGVEECFLAGLDHAAGDAVIFMYTDLQDPPETMREMLAAWRNGADIVHTVRRRRIGETRRKVIAAWLAYRLIDRLSDVRIPADSGEFKLMSRRVVEHLRTLRENDPYLRGLISWIGYNQAFVEYDLQPRAFGGSKIALFGRKAQSVLISGLVSFSDAPIRAVLTTGLVGLLAAILLILPALALAGFQGLLYPFILLLWSILMLAVAVVGIYVHRIHKDVRGRPRWIVDSVENIVSSPK